jgi:hypothetical protein
MSDLTAADVHPAELSQLSSFEFWPDWIFYAPVVAYWIALGIRYRDLSLPSAANPGISTGGLCGESKSSILDQAGPTAAAWIARYGRFRTGDQDEARAIRLMDQKALSLPIVVKPDIGCNGTGVRLAEDSQALVQALAAFPRGVDLLLQELIPHEGEAGIFYIRHPAAEIGTITSLTHKKAPILFGDGKSTIHDLIMADARTRLVPHLYLPRLKARLHEVPELSKPVRLLFAGNHCKGSIFTNGASDITHALSTTIHQIMSDVPGFHFGRIDVRYQSIASLRRGTGLRIIEINGVGSEATHIWDPSTRLRDAYRTQFEHYRQAFEIGASQRAAGIRSSGVFQMFKDWRMQRCLMASYPLND